MHVAERINQQHVPPATVAIWWLGQNSYHLKFAHGAIMIDPFFTWAGPPEKYLYSEPPLRPEELSPQAVFCTHDHSDHTDAEFLVSLANHSPETRFYGPPESGERMRKAGISPARIQVLNPDETVAITGASAIVARSKTEAVSDVGHYSYIFDIEGVKVYDSGDVMRGVTNQPALLKPLQQAQPDIALITTSPTEEEFPDFAEAAALAQIIGAKVAVPAHYECFTKRTYDPKPFINHVRRVGLHGEIIPYCGCLLYSDKESKIL